MKRIEVKTGYFNKNGTIYPNPSSKDKFDILAIVIGTQIIYIPEI